MSTTKQTQRAKENAERGMPFPTTGLRLGSGPHARRRQGVCVMEAVAWFAGEKHDDHPRCVDDTLIRVAIGVNDSMSEAGRQRLIPLIPLLAGTADDGLGEAR